MREDLTRLRLHPFDLNTVTPLSTGRPYTSSHAGEPRSTSPAKQSLKSHSPHSPTGHTTSLSLEDSQTAIGGQPDDMAIDSDSHRGPETTGGDELVHLRSPPISPLNLNKRRRSQEPPRKRIKVRIRVPEYILETGFHLANQTTHSAVIRQYCLLCNVTVLVVCMLWTHLELLLHDPEAMGFMPWSAGPLHEPTFVRQCVCASSSKLGIFGRWSVVSLTASFEEVHMRRTWPNGLR